MQKNKKIFIYYSLTGNGKLIAKKLEKECDIRKIVVKKELPKSFFLQMMVGGFKSLINYKEKLDDKMIELNGSKQMLDALLNNSNNRRIS